METTEKMLTRQVSSVVRLHVAACGVPPRWRVGRLLELQLIQPRTVAVPSGCSSPRKGGDHGSTTSGDVVTAGGDTRLPSATAATKGHTRRCGIGGSLRGGRLHLRCRGMRPPLARWLPTIVPIRCYVQGCAWCLSHKRRTTLWGRW
jgi:hypothetical protein